jgi:crotonobetainyl-CoA:carnitine CoA-transferase CaiB-like acyl-CoA transferase
MNSTLPCEGVRVVEFAHMVMGPTCGLILADLGADVIKVEPAKGDNTRRLAASGAGFWPAFNRNKRSLALDVGSPEGQEIIKKLVQTADVVTENFRPGAMKQLGLGYDDFKPLRPDIIYCSLKGFLKGPYGHRVALDEVVQMMGGLAYMTGLEGQPLRAGASVNDIMGGMFGVIAILAAIIERNRTGQGQYIEGALYENNVFLMAQHMLQYSVTGVAAPPMSNRLVSWGIYDVFTSSDGQQVFVGVVTDTQWKTFCDAFRMTKLAADRELSTNNQRVQARERVLPVVREAFSRMTKAELIEKCERVGLPFAPVMKPQELFDDPHLTASGGLAEITLADGRKARAPKLPFEMDGRRFGTRLDLPPIGSHTKSLLNELGYPDSEIRQLSAKGVIRITEEEDCL